MTRNRIALAAATAAAVLVLPAVPANAHDVCWVEAANPVEVPNGDDSRVSGWGQLWCDAEHDLAGYNLTICVNHSPVVLPGSGSVTVGGTPVPVPSSRPVVCGFASQRDAHGAYGGVYVGCPYLPGYYQTHVFNGTATGHPNVSTKFDYSDWVFISGANCGLPPL